MASQSKLGTHKTTVYSDGNYICVKYHETDVVKFNDFEIILNSGGWYTDTTKTRMNQASNQYRLGYKVFQKDFDWFVDYNGTTIPFNNNTLERNIYKWTTK